MNVADLPLKFHLGDRQGWQIKLWDHGKDPVQPTWQG